MKLKIALMTGPGDNGMFAIEAADAVSRPGGIGTYLANFQNEDVRFRSTGLTNALSRIVMAARAAPPDSDVMAGSSRPTNVRRPQR